MECTFAVITKVRLSLDPTHRSMTAFLYAVAFLAPLTSHAAVLELVCENLRGQDAIYLEIGPAKNKVVSGGLAMEEVIVNKNEIIFVRDLGPAGRRKHTLNRISGNLVVQPPGSNDLFSPWWKCEKATQKF